MNSLLIFLAIAVIVILILIVVGIACYKFFIKNSIKQVNEGSVAFIRHWGKVLRDDKGNPKVLQSGFYRVNPISKRIDVLPSPNRRMYQDLQPMKFFTNDNATLTVVARLQYRITNPYVFEYDADNPILQVATIIQSNLRKAINSLSFQQAIGQASVIGRVISDSVKDKSPLIVQALVKTVKKQGDNLKGQDLTKAINSEKANLVKAQAQRHAQIEQQQQAIKDQIASYGIQVSQATLKEVRPDTDLLDRMNARKEADLQAQANVATANGQKSVAIVSAEGRASVSAASASGSKASANIQADASAYSKSVNASATSNAASMSANAASNVQTVHAKAGSNALSMSANADANSTSVSAKAKASAISNIADAKSANIAKVGKAYNNMGSNYLQALAIKYHASALGQLGSKSKLITNLGTNGGVLAKLLSGYQIYQDAKKNNTLPNSNHSANLNKANLKNTLK